MDDLEVVLLDRLKARSLKELEMSEVRDLVLIKPELHPFRHQQVLTEEFDILCFVLKGKLSDHKSQVVVEYSLQLFIIFHKDALTKESMQIPQMIGF